MKRFVIPVIPGATGTVTKGLKEFGKQSGRPRLGIPGKHSVGCLRRTQLCYWHRT